MRSIFTLGIIILAVTMRPSVVLVYASTPAIVNTRTFSWDAASDPENVFWPSISWWWNGTLDPDILRGQLEDMKAHDVRNTLVFPFYDDFRTGNYHMDPDYLTAGYLDRVQVVVDKAEELGMNIWLNADGGWPIGYALRHDPQYATQYATYQLVYSNGTWTETRNTNAYETADLLSAQTTAAFLDMTYKPYVAKLGSQLGDTVPLMASDEAAYKRFYVGDSIPWTPQGRTLFQNRFGYDVLADNKLYAFAVQPSQLTNAQKQVRVDVIDFVSGQFCDSYFKQSRDWCRTVGMAQIGRLAGDDETMGAIKYGYGSMMRQLRAVDVPGIDAIWRQIFPGQPNGNYPKYASSAAHQNGTAIVSSLSFPVYGEGLTPSQMKWIMDYQFVRGITQYATESYPVSTQDDSITDLRPQWNTSPLWDYMPDFHRYTARVGYLMSCGQPDIDVGLYYPVRDIWANADSSDSAVVGFDSLTQKLLELQCDYDIIDDDILNDAATRVENGRLVLGAMSYGTIVVGPTQWMTDTAQQRLTAFETAGGQVIRINDVSQIDSAITAITPTIELSTPSSALRVAKRTWDGGGTVFFFNEGESSYNGIAALDLEGTYYTMDPSTGITRSMNAVNLDSGLKGVSLNLAPGESMLLVSQPSDDVPDNLQDPISRKAIESLTLSDGWTARVDRQYLVGEHDYEVQEFGNSQFQAVDLGRWASTLGLSEDFSGHVTYRKTVSVPESLNDKKLYLELGGLEYAARVLVDGQEVGCVLWSPWCIELPELNGQTQFTLDVEMSNTLANEITSQSVQDYWSSQTGPGWPDNYCDKQLPFEQESRGGGLLGPVYLHFDGLPAPAISEFITPVAVATHSGTEPSPYTADKIIDGVFGSSTIRNLASFTDDTNPISNPISGHVILDLGRKLPVNLLKIWARGDSGESFLPEDMDIFYYADDEWSDNTLLDDIEGDADIISIWSGVLEDLAYGESQIVDFNSTIRARYIGLRINSSYGWDAFQMGEVAVGIDILAFIPGDANHDGIVNSEDAAILAANWLSNGNSWSDGDFNGDNRVNEIDASLLAANWNPQQSADVPEPGMLVFLSAILLGLLAHGWRTRSRTRTV